MIARRLLTAAVTIAWLLPATVAGAIALHVALEHADGPAGQGHESVARQTALAALARHSHAHAAGNVGHEHSVAVLSCDIAARRALDSPALERAAVSSGMVVPWEAGERAVAAARSTAGPPQVSGPPLLARLSTFRI